MRPKHNIRPFAGLRARLEFVRQPVRCLDFHWHAEILLKFLTDLGQPAIAFVAADPDRSSPSVQANAWNAEQRRNNPETSFVIIQRVGVLGGKKISPRRKPGGEV